MRPTLEWHTDEDGITAQPELDATSPSPGKRTLRLIIVLAAATMLAFLLASLIGRRQADRLAQVRNDVVLAFNLQQDAIQRGDGELYTLTLSLNDRAWQGYQEKLFETGFFRDEMKTITEQGQEPLVSLSPDLRTALVSYERYQLVEMEQTAATSMKLQHTAVFRLENERWLQSAPDPSFWGSWQTVAGERVAVNYPDRDAPIALKLAADIDAAISAMCGETAGSSSKGFCQAAVPIRLRMASEPEALIAQDVLPSVSANQFDLRLPAPSLLGIPVNESDYEVYADFYLRPLLEKLEAALSSTVALPDQSVYMLCYDHPLRGQHLYRYSRQLNTWEPILPQQAFKDLSVSPDDSSILLANHGHVTVYVAASAARIGDETAAWQRRLNADLDSSLVGWMETKTTPYLLLQSATGIGELPRYSMLDLSDCNRTACAVFDVPGFPSVHWSGEAALFSVGSDVYLGSQNGTGGRLVGKGFSPFWLDQDRFGFVRFAGEGATMTTELVVGQIDGDVLEVLLDGNDLARATGILEQNVLFINEVLLEPGSPETLLLSATGIRSYAGRSFIFTADLTGWRQNGARPDLKFQLERDATIGDVPGQLTPTGEGRFIVSPDGQWLAMTELHGHDRETWSIILHDLLNGTLLELEDSVPATPGNFPLLDWSADGRWLLAADRRFLRLISPRENYQEKIEHSFDACTAAVWAGQ